MKPSPGLVRKWSRRPRWRPEEGVDLAFGLDPEAARKVRSLDPPLFVSPDRERFKEIARRAVSHGELEEEATPSAFLEWAEGAGLAFHETWRSTLYPRIPVGPDGESETARQTVTRVSEFVLRRDELIDQWALAPTWTLREGACLANNVSPRLLSQYGHFPSRHAAADKVNRLIKFALRAMRQWKLDTDPTPAEFIAWSESVGFPFDAKWRDVVGEPRIERRAIRSEAVEPSETRISSSATSDPKSAPAQEPGTRVKETMLKIIIGLAVDGYGYDPRSRRSEIPGSIANELDKLGIPVTAETVRKYLDEGARLLSEDVLEAHFRMSPVSAIGPL